MGKVGLVKEGVLVYTMRVGVRIGVEGYGWGGVGGWGEDKDGVNSDISSKKTFRMQYTYCCND